MTLGLRTLLLIVALVLFCVAAAGVSPGRVSLVAAGLAFVTAAEVFG